MRIVVIGGTGHIGGHLVPMLVQDGFETVVIARGKNELPSDDHWRRVKVEQGTYRGGNDPEWTRVLGGVLRAGDTVVDIIGNDLASVYDVARQRDCQHVIACGSVWMLGTPRRVPFFDVTHTNCPFAGYAERWRIILQTQQRGIAGDGPTFCAILPPNICGPGKIPLDTTGDRNIEVHRALSRGQSVILPEGPDALIGPCDAEDVARAFHLATRQPQRAAGEIFNVGAAYALTASEFVAAYGQIYGVRNPIQHVPWKEFAEKIVPDAGARYHFEAHMCPDISKLCQRLGYEPRHTPEQTMWRAVQWMRQGRLL